MMDYRRILMLRSMGRSQREMERNKIASRETTKEIFDVADRLGVCWPLADDVTNADLELLLFPDKYKNVCMYVEPDYPYIHTELAKNGITLTLLWEEYRAKCYKAGKTPYMSTQFAEKYRKWAKVTKATMRVQHKPGDAMEVDWAGDTIPVFDSVTGEVSAAYLFVAVLPCSCFVYAEACSNMTVEGLSRLKLSPRKIWEGRCNPFCAVVIAATTVVGLLALKLFAWITRMGLFPL